MTAGDKSAFAQAVVRLAAAHREKNIDANTMRVYFAGMEDRPIEFVVAAAERLMLVPYFPKLAEWRLEAVKVEAERLEAQRALLRKLPSPLCLDCSDTGWSPDADDRVHRCDCQKLRRLELLGRRPWPALPEATPLDSTDAAIDRDEASSLIRTIERRTGQRVGPRVVPRVRQVVDEMEASND